MEPKSKKKIALSPATLDANRANALKSSGPRTPEGQRRSAANVRVTPGFRTDEPKLSEPDLAEIAELEIRLTAQWQPATPESTALVREAAAARQIYAHEPKSASQNHRIYTYEPKLRSLIYAIYTHEPKLQGPIHQIYTHEPKPPSAKTPSLASSTSVQNRPLTTLTIHISS